MIYNGQNVLSVDAIPSTELIAIGVLCVVRTPNLWEGQTVGVGDGTVRKSYGEFL